MKKHLSFSFICTLLLFFNLSSKSVIIETNDLSEILKHAKQNSLVLVDLDNTVARPTDDADGVASDGWFSSLFKEHKDISLVLPHYHLGQNLVWLQPAANNTIHVLEELKKSGATLLGFTARDLFVAARTHEQLEHAGISLENKRTPKKDFVFPDHQNGTPVIYSKSIVFCGNNTIDAVLPSVVQKFKKTSLKSKPVEIIFADDKLKNVEIVQAAAEKEGLDFVGIRYGGCDDYVKTFNPKKAKRKFGQLKADAHKRARRYKRRTIRA